MAKSKPSYGRGTGIGPIDVHVGARVRLRRTLLGMNQTKLGDALGLTFQQVQKYEKGANRIGSSRLYDLARVFDVPIEHLPTPGFNPAVPDLDFRPGQALTAAPVSRSPAGGVQGASGGEIGL